MTDIEPEAWIAVILKLLGISHHYPGEDPCCQWVFIWKWCTAEGGRGTSAFTSAVVNLQLL